MTSEDLALFRADPDYALTLGIAVYCETCGGRIKEMWGPWDGTTPVRHAIPQACEWERERMHTEGGETMTEGTGGQFDPLATIARNIGRLTAERDRYKEALDRLYAGTSQPSDWSRVVEGRVRSGPRRPGGEAMSTEATLVRAPAAEETGE